MSDGDALLRAVCEFPDEDTPRLVYADWLDENGEPERAAIVRAPSLPEADLRSHRTRRGRPWYQYADKLLAGVLPKTYFVWPLPYPTLPMASLPGGNHESENWLSWSFAESSRPLLCTRPALGVGIRHGFIEAVSASLARIVKLLPHVVRRQPVRHVAIHYLFLEWECMMHPDEWDGPRHSRVIRQNANKIPEGVFKLLTPEISVPTANGAELYRAYPNATAAYEDLSRAFLIWARAPHPRRRIL